MFSIQEELKKLPDKPGVYIMKDINNNIIYVGKAIVLKNRVRQYFNSNLNHSNKVIRMVSNIHSFEYIITDSELEALILECNLIKQYRPKFNVLLKDDKNYPYIKITTKEEFPRVIITRKLEKDGCKYYGPYSNSKAVKDIMDIINEYFPTKRCKKNLSKKTKECLNYHIGKCKAPCIGAITKDEYNKMIHDICEFLDGNKKGIKKYLSKLMKEESDKLNFEKAAKIRDVLRGFEHFEEEQKVLDIHLKDKDVIGFFRGEQNICIQVFFVRQGKLVGRNNFIIDDVRDEKDEEVIASFMKQFYTNFNYIPKEIFVPLEVDERDVIKEMFSDIKGSKVSIITPKRGENLRLVELVNKNAEQEFVRRFNKEDGILYRLKKALNLSFMPSRIEAYDVSNTGNENIVVSMVVITDGIFNKKEYRRFRIKSQDSQNDYLAMQEAVYRRFNRFKNNDLSFSKLPNLILLDGGKGHVSCIKDILEEFNLDILLAGMVKDDKHRTRGLILDNNEISLENDKDVLNFITRIQDETHRFAIDYNKKLRQQKYKKSSLDDIHGIGESKKKALIKYFKTIDNIKKASIDDLTKVDGINFRLAKSIKEYYEKR